MLAGDVDAFCRWQCELEGGFAMRIHPYTDGFHQH